MKKFRTESEVAEALVLGALMILDLLEQANSDGSDAPIDDMGNSIEPDVELLTRIALQFMKGPNEQRVSDHVAPDSRHTLRPENKRTSDYGR